MSRDVPADTPGAEHAKFHGERLQQSPSTVSCRKSEVFYVARMNNSAPLVVKGFGSPFPTLRPRRGDPENFFTLHKKSQTGGSSGRLWPDRNVPAVRQLTPSGRLRALGLLLRGAGEA
jgi:hypothetical protein